MPPKVCAASPVAAFQILINFNRLALSAANADSPIVDGGGDGDAGCTCESSSADAPNNLAGLFLLGGLWVGAATRKRQISQDKSAS